MINPDASTENRAETVDIKEYVAVLLKRKWLILVCFLLSMAGTTAFLFTRQSVYRASARLLVTTAGPIMPTSDVVRNDEGSFYNTQIAIMQSQTMLTRVRQRLKKSQEDITELLRALNISGYKGLDIITISVDSTSRDFAKDFANTLADEYLRFRDEERAKYNENALLLLTREINRLSQELKASNERLVNFIRDHEMVGVDELRKLAQEQLLSRFGNAASALAEAQTRKELIETKPGAASALVILASSGGTAASQGETSGYPSRDATGLGSAALQLGGAPAAGGTDAAPGLGLKSGAAPSKGVELSAVEDSDRRALFPGSGGITYFATEKGEHLFGLQNRQQALQARLQQLRTLYRDKHPAVVDTENQLENTTKEIASEVQLVREQTAMGLVQAQLRFEKAKAALDEMNAAAFKDRSTQLELKAIEDDVERVKGLYKTMLGKLVSIDVNSSFNPITVSVLEQALLYPDPVYPKKLKGMLMAAAFGIGLGLALAFFIEYIDDSIKLAEDVERELQLPFLGMIPAAQWDPDDLSAHRLDKLKQQGGVAEAYRVVRSAILFSTPKEKLRSLLVTSAVPREGKTTTCVNMAVGFSQVEDRVLLVDADLRRGEVNKYFGLDRDKGLADVLLGEATPEECIKHSDVPKLDVMTSGAYPSNPAELLLGWRLKEFLDWGYKNYNRVIFDGPPVMGIADSAILGSAVDGVMLVIWAGRTSRRYVRVAKMTAVSRGAKIFGFMLNNLEPSRVGYYHYYPYYYSYYTRGYYYSYHKDDAPGKGGDLKGVEVPTSNEPNEDDIDDVY